MASKTTAFLVLILFFLCSFSTGDTEDFNTTMNLVHSLNKVKKNSDGFDIFQEFDMEEDILTDGFQMEMRKLLMVDRPDYDDPVANPKHEPKKPGTGKP